MVESLQQTADYIPESRAARISYRVALIPVLGLFLYMFVAFVALYQLGKGMTGFYWLRKGLWRMCRMTGAVMMGAAIMWFYPFRYSDSMGEFEEGQGYCIRRLAYPEQTWKIGHWQYFAKDKKLSVEGDYWFDKMDGKWIRWLDEKQKLWEKEYYKGVEHGPCVEWNFLDQKLYEGAYRYAKKNGPWSEWYRNGNMKSQGTYEDGNMIGLWTFWDDDGKKKEAGEFQAGKKSGIWTSWHPNGIKESEGEYRNDVQHGKWIHWYDSDHIASEIQYQDGEPTGRKTEWYENGNMSYMSQPIIKELKIEQWYEDGQIKVVANGSKTYCLWYKNGRKCFEKSQDGKMGIWYENGLRMAQGKEEDGYIQMVAWHINGTTLFDGVLQYSNNASDFYELFDNPDGVNNNGFDFWAIYKRLGIDRLYEVQNKMTGVQRLWDEDGRPLGLFVSKSVERFDNGRKKSEGYCFEQKQFGKWTYWYDYGKKQEEGEFLLTRERVNAWSDEEAYPVDPNDSDNMGAIKSCKVGVWTEYLDGYKRKTCEYVDGQKNGRSVCYIENGLIIAEGDYRDDLRHGIWTSYYENGNKMCEETFEKDVRNGSSVSYFKNGNKSTEGEYCDGHKTGVWTYWYENGQKWYRGAFGEVGNKDGLWTYWYENGMKSKSGHFDGGYKSDRWQYWDESGALLKTEFYGDEGEKMWTKEYKNNKLVQ